MDPKPRRFWPSGRSSSTRRFPVLQEACDLDGLNIVEGKMQYLFDESGRRYLDAFAGIVIVSVCHEHPAIVDAVVKQTKLLQHTTTIYLHHAVANCAEALAQRMPAISRCRGSIYFVNSGSEANDIAMMMDRLYTGSFDIVAL